jgi:uncharacterized membrane protein YraQ (UPF0718 family)
MNALTTLLLRTLEQVALSLRHNWPFLAASIVIAVLLKLYLDPRKVSAFLLRHRRAGVIGATAVAVTTPLCSCGTTAVVLGMMASMMPWAPIIAFMVASPLTSPGEFVYSVGLFGWPFAIMFLLASIALGLLGGLAAGILESRGWLKNQTRFATPASDESTRRSAQAGAACACGDEPALAAADATTLAFGVPQPAFAGCGCDAGATIALASVACCVPMPGSVVATCGCNGMARSPEPKAIRRVTARQFVGELSTTGRQLLLLFLGFAFIGYFLIGLIPAAWIAKLFGAGNVFSVPLAATLGLPLYINSEGSLPLVRALIDGGMSQGAALAFLITGAGTSVGAVAGALMIARWRVLALVIGTLWVGAIVTGFLFDFLLAAGAF